MVLMWPGLSEGDEAGRLAAPPVLAGCKQNDG